MKALLPLSWLYAAGVAADRRARMVPKADTLGASRVISIGNLEAGGNGKTPLAIHLLDRLTATGSSVAYVSRGYRGRSVSAKVVACVPAHGGDARFDSGARLLSRSHPDLAREIGDEGALVVRRAPGASALFCADKRRAVAAAVSLGSDVVVLDDGFQSWRVIRHADIVLLDAANPLDAGALIPAGRLREGPRALKRADAVVFNGVANAADLERARAQVSRWLRAGVAVSGMVRRVVLHHAGDMEATAPGRVLAVSGIARPRGFVRALQEAGVQVAAHDVFRDHHRYTARDALRIEARMRREDVRAMVTTEKDWTKLRHLDLDADVWIARLDVLLIGDPLPV